MNIDIAKTTDIEIQDIINILVKNGFYQEDEMYVTINTPFITNPGANNQIWKTKLGIVLYPKLLSYYGDKHWKTVPWICLRMEFEETPDEIKEREICNWFKDKFEEMKIPLFKDEDAFAGYFTREKRNGYVKLSAYTNPSYSKGYWENHTL